VHEAGTNNTQYKYYKKASTLILVINISIISNSNSTSNISINIFGYRIRKITMLLVRSDVALATAFSYLS